MAEPEPRSDRELVEGFRGGDREAFTALYRKHFPAVYRFATFMTGDRIRASEITQDVFVWLVHHPGEFDAERGDLAAFLGGVARKFVQRRLHSERRWLPFDEVTTSGAAEVRGTDIVSGLERQQETAALHKAIAALPLRYREAIVVCDLQGKSYEEAAVVLDCAMGTVRSRLHRARELLARKFQCGREGQRC